MILAFFRCREILATKSFKLKTQELIFVNHLFITTIWASQSLISINNLRAIMRIFIIGYKKYVNISLKLSTIITVALLIFICNISRAQEPVYPGKNWIKSDSIDYYWSHSKLDDVKKFADSIGTASLFIVQNGKVILDWGRTSENLDIFSARKSLLSGLYGIYSDKGIINISSTLADIDIDDKSPSLTPEEKSAKISDLLKARSGIYHKAAYETPGMEKNRPKRGEYKPGEHWFYNNWDFNALTTIFEKIVSKSVFQAFNEQFAIPLTMENFDVHKNKYHYEDQSVHPATIWFLSAHDLARFGLLYLRKGKWKDKQILSNKWVNESTNVYSDLGMFGGYGYCWWVALKGEHFPFIKIPDGTFSARGTGEQTLLVIPAYNLIVVHQTKVTSPDDYIMSVVDFAKLLKKILDSRISPK